MRRRYQILGLGIALWSVATSSSESLAQFGNSTNHPVLTYLGRYHGVGYSQGYHACKTGNCNPVSQLYQAPSSPEIYAPVPAPPVARDPWPEFSGRIWNPIRSLGASPADSYSLYSSPDDMSSFGAERSSIVPEPVQSVPSPSRPALPSSPSDRTPRVQSPATSGPLPAPKLSEPQVKSSIKLFNPAATRFQYR